MYPVCWIDMHIAECTEVTIRRVTDPYCIPETTDREYFPTLTSLIRYCNVVDEMVEHGKLKRMDYPGHEAYAIKEDGDEPSILFKY